MAIEAVLLDVGGTLLTEHPSRAEVYARAGRRRGLDLDAARARRLMYGTARALPRVMDGHFRYSEAWFGLLIERMFVRELGLSADELPELRRELFAHFADPSSFRLYPGTMELLDSLRSRGLVVGIASNWSERLPDILGGLEVTERVAFVLVSALEGCEKPEPEFFRLALERAGVDAAATVHAGNDLVLDVRGAQDCGILPVLVDHAGVQSLPRRDPPERVTDLFQLERWIAERAT